MPDASGKLLPQDKETIVRWLGERGAGQHPCPACGNNGWTIDDQLTLLPSYSANGLMAGSGFPTVVLVCSRCAFFRMHSAGLIGIRF